MTRKMTQTDLADKIGVSFQQLQKYERGANRISASRLWRIAVALEAPMTYFFEGITTGSDALIEQPIVTPWANELMALEADLPASARKLVLNMARQLAEREAAPA
ncbi:helix-turn-helix domain-containing protein [Brevundimonas intermedia]|uniref:helix-turn-helix domain-containing protein n=1 Tax=Brevundimonas intermedia TaxID=74315 RepID=UPI003D3595A2